MEPSISPQEVQNQSGRGNYSKISNYLRKRMISYIEKNPDVPITVIAKIFDVNPRTLRDIYKKFKESGVTSVTTKGGAHNVKILEIHLKTISTLIDDHPLMTLQEIQQRINQIHGLTISKRTVERAIDKLNITVKLTRLAPDSRNTPKIIETRFAYSKMLFDRFPLGSPNLIYVDETTFNLYMRRKFWRSISGTHVDDTVPNSKVKNISVAAAITCEGLVHHRTLLDSYNSKEFYTFLQECIQRTGTKQKYFIMDNERFRHVSKIKKLIEACGHKQIFLPQYSPQLNPIELMFSKWKQIVKTASGITIPRQLQQQILTASNQITSNDCREWLNEMSKYISLALQRCQF